MRWLAIIALSALAAGCSGGLGDFCQGDDDCNSGLTCRANGPGQRGVCAYPPSGDAGVDSASDVGRDTRDARDDATDAAADTTDAAADATDAAAEASPDAGADSVDAATDATDSGVDVGVDAASEAGAGDTATQ